MIRVRALHLLAQVALRTRAPRDAKAMIDACSRFLPRLRSGDEARRLADALDGSGTCLSRALVVTSLLDGAAVVGGVEPGAPVGPLVHAHAWVEYKGGPLREADPRGDEIVRL